MSTTISSERRNEIPVLEDPGFDLSGFQVVRGEFFAHISEPSISFCNNKVNVNTACIRKLPKTDYVQVLVNPTEKKLAVRPCSEDAKDSIRWCSNTEKRSPKQVTCKIFFAKVMDLMGWSSINRYKLLGKLIKTKNDLLFVFDLTTPEIFLRKNADGEPGTISRTPTYTDDWKDQFGLPFEEHLNNVQVGIFDNYTVFGINTKEFPDVPEPDEGEDVKDHVDNKPI